MTPGPDKIFACPHCDSPARISTIRSGNTIGAIFWTDGRMQAPMLPEAPLVARCEKCRNFYWIGKARVIGEHSPWEQGNPWPEANYVSQLSEDDLYQAVDSSMVATANQELILRKLAWWAGNDPFRALYIADRPDANARSPRFIQNLTRLIQLLDDSDDEQRLMKAEAARQSGKYDLAEKLLAKQFDDRLKPYAELIHKLAAKKDSALQPLNPAD